MRDNRGELKAAKAIHIPHHLTLLLAEIKGILEAMKLARSRNCLRIVVESDSQKAIRFIQGDSQTLGDELIWISEMRSIALDFESISISHVSHMCNSCSHKKWGISASTTCTWVSHYPSWLLAIVKGADSLQLERSK